MKTLKLSLAALGTATALAAVLFVTDRERFRQTYLCWTQAVSLTSCFGNGHFDFAVSINGIRYEGHTGNFVDSLIFYHGAFEKPTLFLLRDLLLSIYSAQGVFIDIGANTGQHSLVLSRYAKEIHAFEPWEPVLKKFRRMVEINGIKNIFIHAYGLGAENSMKPFFKPADINLGTGSFVEGFKRENTYEGELEIQQGDDAFNKEEIQLVSVIKMDIEGYEKPALEGLRNTLLRHRPIIVFELTIDPKNPTTIKSKKELEALLPEKYEFLIISKKSNPANGEYLLESMDGIVRFEESEQHDVVAYPAERKSSIPRRGPINNGSM
jgi:FkbM family methyltransferase